MTRVSDIRLVLTNGESGVRAVRSVLPGIEIVAWNDVLHDGPVLSSDQLDEVSAARAAFLQSCLDGASAHRNVIAEFRARDQEFRNALHESDTGGGVFLWFESDLYDQLQMAQIISAAASKADRLVLVPWHGPLLEGDSRLRDALRAARSLTLSEVSFAKRFWTAFTAQTPLALGELCSGKSGPLAPMHRAGCRLLEEYPGANDGLSASQRRVIGTLREGRLAAGYLFRRCLDLEDDPYMGDWSFFRMVDELVDTQTPAVARIGQAMGASYELTEFGRVVASGSTDFLSRNPIDRWIGGVHLSRPPLWRWNSNDQRISLE